MKLLEQLNKKKLISPPTFVLENTHYATIMGSQAYGVSTDNSDTDVYGFCIPNKEIVFPHTAGYIEGFGRQKQNFEQWQIHGVIDKDKNTEYDFSIYNVIKYFQLCMDNNPNMIDSLFTPDRCVLHMTSIGKMVRENRKMFLHKGAYHKFKGYAFSQRQKMDIKNPSPESKRYESFVKYGYCPKFAYHIIRLLDECEQILTLGDIDLERDKERLKSIRRGEWTIDDIKNFFKEKEKHLENLYNNSKLQHSPNEEDIKQLLLNVLEEHFGDLSSCVVVPNELDNYMKNIAKIIRNAGY